MPPANSDPQQALEEATAAIAVAQTEVDAALTEIKSGNARAEKSIITTRLAVAFEQLTSARERLEAVMAASKK